jgi:hypothetical protein
VKVWMNRRDLLKLTVQYTVRNIQWALVDLRTQSLLSELNFPSTENSFFGGPLTVANFLINVNLPNTIQRFLTV